MVEYRQVLTTRVKTCSFLWYESYKGWVQKGGRRGGYSETSRQFRLFRGRVGAVETSWPVTTTAQLIHHSHSSMDQARKSDSRVAEPFLFLSNPDKTPVRSRDALRKTSRSMSPLKGIQWSAWNQVTKGTSFRRHRNASSIRRRLRRERVNGSRECRGSCRNANDYILPQIIFSAG